MADDFVTIPKQKTISWKDGWKLIKWDFKDALEGYKIKSIKSKEKPLWIKGWNLKDTGWTIKPKKEKEVKK